MIRCTKGILALRLIWTGVGESPQRRYCAIGYIGDCFRLSVQFWTVWIWIDQGDALDNASGVFYIIINLLLI
jgi:hypothetical protein